MKREYGLDQVSRNPDSVVTVGIFDGVHRGHQAILRYLRQRSEARGGTSVVVTFDPHPREVVRGEHVPLLTTISERVDLIGSMGIDHVIVIPFTTQFARLSAEEFVEQILVDKIGLGEIVVGYDHGFGKGRAGDIQLLEQLGRKHGFSVDVIPAQAVDEHVVSSSEIRTLLIDQGDVQLAGEMLGRFYSLEGKVVRGDGRGHQIGFPTANLEVGDDRKVIPAKGVYAVLVYLPGASEKPLAGMMNIGQRPTFNGIDLRIEVHILDFDADLYGSGLRVEFVERLRDERRFSSLEELTKQLSKDEQRCKAALAALF